MTKLAKQAEQLEKLKAEASAEAAGIVIETGAYKLGPQMLKKLLATAASTDAETLDAAIARLKAS
ncbi:MAG TPA: hypothetical protein DF715_07630 [Oceanicaulis sp.]|nr:hypothetical protein [Oceanicaulis sp.]